MSEFKEYKPMEIEHNVKAAVENLRKAYWSNETKKVAKHYTEAEDIIISAICHQHYTVCKETTEGDLISREALRNEIQHLRNANPSYSHNCDVVDRQDVLDEIDSAQAIPLPSNQIAWEQGYEAGLAQGKHDRPKGEWINHRNDYGHNIADCSLCGKTMQWHDEDGDGVPRYCWYCGASMEGGAE